MSPMIVKMTSPIAQPNLSNQLEIPSLSEWTRSGLISVEKGIQAQLDSEATVEAIASLGNKVRIELPRRGGLEIVTNSFVGRVDLGAVRLTINPKLDGLPLTRLLRYTYGLSDLEVLERTTLHDTERYGLQDLFVAMLASEVEKLVLAGLTRKYLQRNEHVDPIRGRLNIHELARQGAILSPRLPCEFHVRSADWHLNRVLLAGLESASHLTNNPAVRRNVGRVAKLFEGITPLPRLHLADIDKARFSLGRLTANAAPALSLLNILLRGQGLAFDQPSTKVVARGFLFDMNKFFQKLLSRFLHENLEHQKLVDESKIYGLYRYARLDSSSKRRPPAPRPDFALHAPNGRFSGYLDAKYRDLGLGKTSLPAKWLYQMTAYALAGPEKVSVLLYAAMDSGGRDECITITEPSSGKPLGRVILRPVPLHTLSRLLMLDNGPKTKRARSALAERLVYLGIYPKPALQLSS
jgi:5-methylcytosine-specific restriction enzyme subunit McrC